MIWCGIDWSITKLNKHKYNRIPFGVWQTAFRSASLGMLIFGQIAERSLKKLPYRFKAARNTTWTRNALRCQWNSNCDVGLTAEIGKRRGLGKWWGEVGRSGMRIVMRRLHHKAVTLEACPCGQISKCDVIFEVSKARQSRTSFSKHSWPSDWIA